MMTRTRWDAMAFVSVKSEATSVSVAAPLTKPPPVRDLWLIGGPRASSNHALAPRGEKSGCAVPVEGGHGMLDVSCPFITSVLFWSNVSR